MLYDDRKGILPYRNIAYNFLYCQTEYSINKLETQANVTCRSNNNKSKEENDHDL